MHVKRYGDERILTMQNEFITFKTSQKGKGPELFVGIKTYTSAMGAYPSFVNSVARIQKAGGLTPKGLRQLFENHKRNQKTVKPQERTNEVRDPEGVAMFGIFGRSTRPGRRDY